MLRRTATLLDLSNNNAGPIDFAAIRQAGVAGVWLKVSEGTGYRDPTYPARAAAARKAGLRVGGYHFARPAPGDAVAQARLFAAELGKIRRRDLRPFLDLEANDHAMLPHDLWTWCRMFGLHVRDLTGVGVLWYTYPGFLSQLRWSSPLGVGAGLLVAEYGPNDGRDHGVTSSVAPWKAPVAHQFTSVGRFPGVHGDVDVWHTRRLGRLLAHRWRGAF